MKTHCYVYIQAINLDQFIYDTDDLATIRGSGIMLLGWPALFELSDASECFRWDEKELTNEQGGKSFPFKENMKKKIAIVTSGASALLLHLRVELDACQIADLCSQIELFLREHDAYRYATFAVSAVAETGDFANCRQQLIAMNRMRQMEMVNIPIPDLNQDATLHSSGKAVDHACDIDGLRPGTESISTGAGDRKSRISKSVHCRREKGKTLKRRLDLFCNDAGTEVPRTFFPTWDFERLTTRGSQRLGGDDRGPDPLQKLAGKMAVIYIDGNRFSRIEDEAARRGPGSLRRWDTQLRNHRINLASKLTRRIAARSAVDWQVLATNADKDAAVAGQWVSSRDQLSVCHRIETLLWGGDEYIWVVPAWKGWETLRFFFQETAGWRFSGNQLTHAAGIVFCHHKAPIRNTVQLGRRLAESAKKHRRDENAIAYQVLESFDHLGDDFERARALQRPKSLHEEDMILRVDDLKQLLDIKKAWNRPDGQSPVPRRRLYQVAETLFQGDQECYMALLNRMSELAFGKTNDAVQAAENLAKIRPLTTNTNSASPAADKITCLDRFREAACWIQLVDLWDYLLPDQKCLLVGTSPEAIRTEEAE